MNTSNPIIKLHTRVRHRQVGADGVVVCMHNGTVLVVNEVGSHIIQKLNESNDVDEIIESVCTEFEVTKDQARSDFDDYVDHLIEKNVVSVETQEKGQS